MAALIKANKGTQYEYPVGKLKEEKRLLYDRLQMHNQVNYTITGENEVESEAVIHTYVDVPQKPIMEVVYLFILLHRIYRIKCS